MSEETEESVMVGVLSPEEFQAQCERFSEQLILTIGGKWHPMVVKSVLANIVAQAIATNVDCLGCANMEVFQFDLNVRQYIGESWEDWQKLRTKALADAGKTEATHHTTGKLH